MHLLLFSSVGGCAGFLSVTIVIVKLLPLFFFFQKSFYLKIVILHF